MEVIAALLLFIGLIALISNMVRGTARAVRRGFAPGGPALDWVAGLAIAGIVLLVAVPLLSYLTGTTWK